MPLDPGAGHLAPPAKLIDPAKLERAYYDEHPDPEQPTERVVFGTSGHRGSAFRRSFNEDHIVAITAAICDWRQAHGVDGPLFLGADTHALSEPAQRTALEVLSRRAVQVLRARAGAFTPTPAVSRAIVVHNRGTGPRADGIVVTPSHNPPDDGGFKYNPPHGGPAEGHITTWIEKRANELLVQGVRSVPRTSVDAVARSGFVSEYDFLNRYIEDLPQAVDMEAIARLAPKIGVDPMGGASVEYWGRIGEKYGLHLTVTNKAVDKTFSFVPLDHDGKIRTDCSSPYPMAPLLAIKDQFDVAIGNDGDADRHGIVTPGAGLLSPNHYLSAAVDYLLRHRLNWPAHAAVGKTAVTSSVVERVARAHGRSVLEVPVGFKWFVPGLQDGSLVFGGEESAGACFLARDGSTWTTDKDGILLGLLAAEIVAVTKTDPGALYASLEAKFGTSHYERRDAPADERMRDRLKRLVPDDWSLPSLAGDPVVSRQISAAGGGPLGGLKVSTAQGWFAVRPSGTEDVYKVYAESFRSNAHLEQILSEAAQLVAKLE
ncbi:MAG TPA: phosphoglucomutase, alpha-D-glucose phosphate-specific [Polyangiaceae bacterium]|jgi:phosphoglucomutase